MNKIEIDCNISDVKNGDTLTVGQACTIIFIKNEIKVKTSKGIFKKWCKSKGIDGVNSETAFRWDEVIEFGKYLYQNKINITDEELIALAEVLYIPLEVAEIAGTNDDATRLSNIVATLALFALAMKQNGITALIKDLKSMGNGN